MPQAPSAAPEQILARAHPFETFIEANFKKILLGVVVLAAAFVAVGVSRHSAHEAEMEAAERFTSATTLEDCDIVIQKYPSTAAAGNALLLKAELQWVAGKKESSVDLLKEFLKGHAKHPLHAQAMLGLASKQESLGDKAAARSEFEALIAQHPTSELAPAAQLRIGDLDWSEGKQEEAKKTFETLPRNYAGKIDAFMDQVRQRTEIMGAGLPEKEVDGPPPAPKPASQFPLPGINTPMPAPKVDLTPPAPPASSTPALDSKPKPVPAPTAPAPAPAAPTPVPAPAATTPAPIPAAPAIPAPKPDAAPAPAPVVPAPAPKPEPAAPTPPPATENPAPAKQN